MVFDLSWGQYIMWAWGCQGLDTLPTPRYNSCMTNIIHVKHPNGSQSWRLNNVFHREDGPAYTAANGYRAWYLHGKLHKVDGPAIILENGEAGWYLENKRMLSYEEFQEKTGCADETIIMFKLRWGSFVPWHTFHQGPPP